MHLRHSCFLLLALCSRVLGAIYERLEELLTIDFYFIIVGVERQKTSLRTVSWRSWMYLFLFSKRVDLQPMFSFLKYLFSPSCSAGNGLGLKLRHD
ncbi:hypothetical protein DFS33DRAFT_1329698 [Desarmillaria ectypa]|nr:hypothetical protein DFS33DRAFT_1329698 [Desarmillaria ectypa]